MKTQAKSLSTLIDEQCKKWEVEEQMAPDTSAQEIVVRTREERKRSWITGLIAALSANMSETPAPLEITVG